MGSCSLLPNAADDAWGDTTHITADFDNSAGIYEGNPVTVLGLEVGKVEKVTPKGTRIEVRLSIKSQVKIPKDAVAAIISPSIVTDRHIELTPVYTWIAIVHLLCDLGRPRPTAFGGLAGKCDGSLARGDEMQWCTQSEVHRWMPQHRGPYRHASSSAKSKTFEESVLAEMIAVSPSSHSQLVTG